ncbi:MAG: glycosyltransferase [Dehalococcoidales bacterium]|jgi:glycosyltransferase involved in cell wall biosynthesis
MAKITVMIPTYNYAQYLGAAIQSVLDQTYQDFEIIVVDDGSTDNTREVVDSFKDTRIRYIRQENRGVAAAANVAIKAATSEYITGIGADDLFLPQNLELKVKIMDARPELGMVYSDVYLFDDSTGETIGKLWRDPKGYYPWLDPIKAARNPLKEILYKGCFILIQAALIRREVFNKVGCYDESLPTHEDWELVVRILQNYPAEIIDMPLLKMRRHQSNLSDNQEKMYQGAVTALMKVIRSGTLTKQEQKVLRKRLFPQHIRYGRRALLEGRTAAARKALLAGIKINPQQPKPYAYLTFSLLGSRMFLTLNKWKKGLRRHAGNHRQPGETQPDDGRRE